jgi:hypothetical protein
VLLHAIMYFFISEVNSSASMRVTMRVMIESVFGPG